jgi:hypothetical protein
MACPATASPSTISAKLQHDLLFGPIAPQFQSAFLPQLGSIKGCRDRISFGLREPFLAPFSRAVSIADPFSR